MVEKSTMRWLCAICTCCWWLNYYGFLNNCVRGCQICIDVFDATVSAVWKGIFCVFMCCCFGFECVACVLCIYSCIELFNDPCQRYQAEDSWINAFWQLVYLKDLEIEGTVREKLKEIFAK
ncbi:unnamed protein product [Paramecium pentaurelia]|uniref:Uncharacterized protein n=1 Tax=Paramecium pentaurelia TaxID=43138 RepID=A0A8S1V5G4_9CILI|nr:unnamed protein product [Paramecium pentaurelia]